MTAQRHHSKLPDLLRAVRRRLSLLTFRMSRSWRCLVRGEDLFDVLNELPEGIVVLDNQQRYIAWNRQYLAMYSRDADLLKVGGRFESAVRRGLRRGDYPAAAGNEETWLRDRLNRLDRPKGRYEHELADGRVIQIEDRRTAKGEIVSLRVDITDLRRREDSFRHLFESNPVPMIVCEQDSWKIKAVNDAAVGLYRFSRTVLMTMHFPQLFAPLEDALRSALGAGFEATLARRPFIHVTGEDTIIELELRANRVDYESQPSVMIAITDVTDKRRNERRIRHVATHDSLTGLANRAYLLEVMRRLEADADRKNCYALLLMDLDNFKTINDTFGHAAGDELLQHVSRRITTEIRATDLAARLGGDEFAVLLTSKCDRNEAASVCQRILAVLQTPYTIGEKEISIGASVGIAFIPDDAKTSEEVLRCADVAMYAAKRERRGSFRFFDAELDEAQKVRQLLECQLRSAIANGELEVHYQPLVALKSDRITCMEALVRWRHPENGLIAPSQFIPIAEETGLIAQVGRFVLQRACSDAAQWSDEIKVAVNVSAFELNQPDFLPNIKSALAVSGLPPDLLQIEVTETAIMHNIETAIAVLTQVRAFGVEVAMDDFGTGYSSLGTLRKLPFNKLKIDRSFIHDATSPEGQGVLSAIVSMAVTLGLSTTAEGVETLEQKEIVAAMNCTEMQGYFFSAAKPLADIIKMMKVANRNYGPTNAVIPKTWTVA